MPGDRHVVQLVGMPDGNGYRMLVAVATSPDVGLHEPGATGAAVVDVQNRLMAHGLLAARASNGVFDDNMQQAVYAFQKANGLPRTGVVDTATQADVPHREPAARRARRRATMIEIDKTRQILMVVQNGVRVRYTFNASTGSDHPYILDGVGYSRAHARRRVLGHPPGRRSRPRPARHAVAAEVLHLVGHRGARLHESVPPYPASHGCTRVSNDAINWIWANNIMPIGTTVWVYV